LFFFPGIVALAAAGLALMLGALVFAMTDFYPSQPLVFSFDLLLQPLINLGIAVLLFLILASLLARFLPDLPVFRRLVLAQDIPSGPSLCESVPTQAPNGVRVGVTGTAQTTLRPAGRAEFSGMPVDVVSDGEFIEPGTPVVVLAIRGDQVVVGIGQRGI
jgi:membrane-bound serine protease (ClpP class)